MVQCINSRIRTELMPGLHVFRLHAKPATAKGQTPLIQFVFVVDHIKSNQIY